MSDPPPLGPAGGRIPDRTLQAATNAWMGPPGVPGVVSVAEGLEDDRATIDVYVTADADPADLPDEFDGFPVRVRPAGGPIDALGGES